MKKFLSFSFLSMFVFAFSAFTTVQQPLPDLAITDVQLVCGETRKLIVTITNVGDGRPNRRVAVAIRGMNTASKHCIGLGAKRDLDPIKSGKVCVLEFPLKAPNHCDCDAGGFEFEVLADPDKLIQETDKSNNRQKFTF